MKRPDPQQEVLWSLIRNLSAAEKKYFLKNFKSGSSIPLYFKLFEWICDHEAPDEKMLLKDLGPELTKRNLSYTRFYLQAQLIDAMGQTEKKHGGQAMLIHNVSVIKRLIQSGQHIMALRIWKQSLKIARKLEDFILIKMLKDEYLNFEIYYNSKTSYSKLLDTYYEHIVNYEEFSQIMQLEELCYAGILVFKKSQFELNREMKDRIMKLSGHPMLKSAPGFNPFMRYHYWSLTNGIICFLKSGFEASVAYLEPLIIQWHKRPEFITYRPQAYLEVLNIYAGAAIRIRRIQEVEKLFHNPITKRIKDPYHQSYFTVLKYMTFLRVSRTNGSYSRVNRILSKLKPYLLQWDGNFPADMQRSLLMSAAISCFVMDKFDDADAYARQSLMLFHDKVGTSKAGATQLFLLLIYYEMKDEWLFQNQFNTCYQYYYRKKLTASFEKEIMSALKKTFPFRRNEKSIDLFNKTLTSLKKINSNGMIETCSIFNFPGWIASRIEGHKYKDWAKDHQQFSELY